MAKLITVTVELTIKVEPLDHDTDECAVANALAHEVMKAGFRAVEDSDNKDAFVDYDIVDSVVYDDLDPTPEPMPPEYFTDDRDE